MDDLLFAFTIHYKLFYSLIFRYTRNHWDTEDLLQDVFYNALKANKKKLKKSDYKKWLSKICINTSINFVVKRNRTIPSDNVWMFINNIDSNDECNYYLLLDLIEIQLNSIPIKIRNLIKMHLFYNKSLSSLSIENGITRWHLRKWKKKIADAVKHHV